MYVHVRNSISVYLKKSAVKAFKSWTCGLCRSHEFTVSVFINSMQNVFRKLTLGIGENKDRPRQREKQVFPDIEKTGRFVSRLRGNESEYFVIFD